MAVATDQDPTSLAASVGGTDDLDPTVRSTAVAFTVSITPEPQLSMDLPDSGESVPAEPTETAGVAALAIGGTVADIPDGNSVALLVHAVDPAAAGWFAMGPAIVHADGTWSATAFVGSETAPAANGHRYEVMAIVTDLDPGTLDQPISDPLALDPVAVAAAVPIVVSLADPQADDAVFDDSEKLTAAQPPKRTAPGTPSTPSTVAAAPRPRIVVEGEDGAGDGQEQNRDAASAGGTILLRAGQAQALQFELSSSGTYTLGIAYSNDGGSDTIRVEVDGSPVGRIDTEDTRPAGADPGEGWNVFRLEDGVGVVSLEPGTHSISVSLTTADEYGTEIDYVLLSLVD